MALVLFDSNIIIDYLNGIGEARDELTYWDEPAISVVSVLNFRICSSHGNALAACPPVLRNPT